MRKREYVVGLIAHAIAQVADLSPRRPGFMPMSVHVRFVMDKVSLGQVFLLVLRCFPVTIIPPWLSMLVYNLGGDYYVR
jgi:hypothetical protein